MVGGVKQGDPTNSRVDGFTTTAYLASGLGTFNDGDGTEHATAAGVFYNYGSTNATSNEISELNFPASATSDTVTLENQFGPAYVAWTAPTAGTINVNTSAWDPMGNSANSDGCPGFYVVTSTLGPANPILSTLTFVATGNDYENGNVRRAQRHDRRQHDHGFGAADRLHFELRIELGQRPHFGYTPAKCCTSSATLVMTRLECTAITRRPT